MTRPADRHDVFPVEERATLTVEQAVKVLGIGRRLAYELAGRFEATGGAEGLPVVCLGRCLRVPIGSRPGGPAGDPQDRWNLVDHRRRATDRQRRRAFVAGLVVVCAVVLIALGGLLSAVLR